MSATEPLSAQLRRLLPSTAVNARAAHAALPALADLVKFVESIADDNACHWQPMHERGERADCVGCCASGALAALREQLEARP